MTLTTRHLVTVLAASLLASACGDSAEEQPRNEPASQPEATADAYPSGSAGSLVSPGGNDLGTLAVTDSAEGVSIRIDARGLQPGTHGVAIHSAGKCQGPNFTSAGERSAEAGDLPSVTIESDGLLKQTVTVPGSSLAKLRDQDGSALVLHMNPDNPPADQSGAAGDRIACGVL